MSEREAGRAQGLEESRKLLGDHSFCGQNEDGEDGYCPECGVYLIARNDGTQLRHTEDCKLKRALDVLATEPDHAIATQAKPSELVAKGLEEAAKHFPYIYHEATGYLVSCACRWKSETFKDDNPYVLEGAWRMHIAALSTPDGQTSSLQGTASGVPIAEGIGGTADTPKAPRPTPDGQAAPTLLGETLEKFAKMHPREALFFGQWAKESGLLP